jgi:hypothetical protein
MADFRLLNGKPRATLIQRFDGTVLVLGPKGKKIEFKDRVTLHQIQAKAEKLGWVTPAQGKRKPWLDSREELKWTQKKSSPLSFGERLTRI